MPSANHNAFYKGLKELEDSGLSTRVASDVLYLRTQPQHTPTLEKEFVEVARSGGDPDVRTFGQ